MKGEELKNIKLRMTFGDNQDFNFCQFLLDLPSKLPSAKSVAKFIFKWPNIWYLHFIRFAAGSFQDNMLASSSERMYLAKRFGVDQEESSTALGLLAWRKSALLVLMVLALVVLQTDIYRLITTQEHWLYDEEVSANKQNLLASPPDTSNPSPIRTEQGRPDIPRSVRFPP